MAGYELRLLKDIDISKFLALASFIFYFTLRYGVWYRTERNQPSAHQDILLATKLCFCLFLFLFVVFAVVVVENHVSV